MKKQTPSLLWLLGACAVSACANDHDGADRDLTSKSGNALLGDCVTTTPGVVVAPVIATQPLNLWPPNHKFHSIAVSDCVHVTAACEADVHAEFIWASSDEPVDDIGDGHFAPDIQLDDDCRAVQLRAERQGPKDGRVYKLGVRVTNALGEATEVECAVVVDHDQRGVLGADSGESYRITFDGGDGDLTCDGETEVPPARNQPPAEVPPTDDGPAFIQ